MNGKRANLEYYIPVIMRELDRLAERKKYFAEHPEQPGARQQIAEADRLSQSWSEMLLKMQAEIA